MSTLASLTVSRNFSKRILLVNVDGVFDQLYNQLQSLVEQRLAAPEAVALVELVGSAEEAIEKLQQLNR